MTVLIADDEEPARQTIRTLISRNHLDLQVVAEAADGDEAMDLTISHRPDLAILDIRMPGRNGLETARLIRREIPETAILILTAYKDFSMAQRAVNTGLDGYLLKPVSPRDFAERILLIREKSNTSASIPKADVYTAKVSWRLHRALEFIQFHLAEDLPLEAAAGEAGISGQHLSRLFRDELDTSFVKYVTRLRIEYACLLLNDTTLGVAEIADRCGFSDPNYFAKVFRKNRGINPGAYRDSSGKNERER